jgi:multidrug efflux system membrane fusion protein
MHARQSASPLAATCCSAGRGGDPPAGRPELYWFSPPASVGDAGDNAIYTGEIAPATKSTWPSASAARSPARLVDTGMTEVKAGQPLARLDPADLQLAAAGGPRPVDCCRERIQHRRVRTRALCRFAGKKRFVSQAAFDAKENAFRSAQASLEQARAQSQISGNQASYGTLAAKTTGVITAVLADAGQVVSAGQAVFRLARPEEKEVAIAVPESRLAEFKAAKTIAVNLWAQPEMPS